MISSLRTTLLLTAACAFLSAAGCQNLGTHRDVPTTVVPIADIQDVAGKWSGLLKRRPRTRGDDYVTVMIYPNGTYEFATARTIGVFAGTHSVELDDGKLKEKSDAGYAIFTLYDRNGEQVIMVEALDRRHDYKYRAELTRAP